MGTYLPERPGRTERGWEYDEYVTEVADGPDLQARVNEQNDALLLQAVGEEYGTLLTSVDDLREQRIADSKD